MKTIALSLFVLAFAFLLGSNKVEAQLVYTITATSTAPMYQGGYGSTCFYLRQIHEGQAGYSCDDSKIDPGLFSMDPIFRESVLVQWRSRWLRAM